jgi:cell division protein FtsB
MPRSNRGTLLLFWLMLLIGGAALFACLFLPAWLEYQAARREHAAACRRIAALEDELTRVVRQIEHLQHDPAYLERLNRQEFGIDTPGVEFKPIEVRPPATDQSLADTAASPDDDLATALEKASEDSPFVSVFILDETRPIVMAMSGLTMLVALGMLLRARPSEHR